MQNTVLVADPDPVLRNSISDVLARAGLNVVAETESLAGLRALLRRIEARAIVLGQPDADDAVLEVSRAIRGRSGPALVLLSPIPNVVWIRRVQDAGVDALLGRPPREADLVAAVQMSLGRRREAESVVRELASVRDQLETVTLIEEAKRVLMRTDHLSDSEAHDRLARQAARTGRSLKGIAEAVLLAASVAEVPVR